ncbi:MAG: hypothetical protein M3529_06845 [Actinomycetota bacterium]|nr:hypothetical protein [Actinomycetota bacterium]
MGSKSAGQTSSSDGDNVRSTQETTSVRHEESGDSTPSSSRSSAPSSSAGHEPSSTPGSVSAQGSRRSHEEDLEARRRDEYGGTNIGAAFFGWLVAIGMTLILAGIVGAIAAAVGTNLNVGLSEAEGNAASIGIGAGIALLLVLMLAYFAGGYVAGRMSRFDGGRQGVAVWLIGLVITLLVVGVGVLFGDQYNIFKRVNLPSLPIPTESATIGGLIALAAILLGTLLAAFLGGKVGQRYHRKIDRVGT